MFLALACAAGGAAGAETAAPLSLAEAIARAEQKNPGLSAAREQAEAAAAQGRIAARSAWPRVGLASDWMRSNVPASVFMGKLNGGELQASDFDPSRLDQPEALSHLSTQLRLEAPLDPFGKVGAAADAARANGRAAALDAEEARLDLRLAVSEAYRRTVLARASTEVVERALEGARAREAELEARVTEGAALTSDLLRARARRRQREAELSQNRADASVAVTSLERLIGAPEGESLNPTDKPGAPPPVALTPEQAESRAFAGRAALRAAAERQVAAQALRRGESRSALPDLGAFALLQDDRGRLSGGKTSWGAGLSLHWAALDPTLSQRKARAAAESRAAQAAERAKQDQVRLEVRTALERARAARESYLAAKGGAEEGHEALRVVQERRSAGMATLTDELETEAASLSAELQELKAATEAALADARLARAMGEQ